MNEAYGYPDEDLPPINTHVGPEPLLDDQTKTLLDAAPESLEARSGPITQTELDLITWAFEILNLNPDRNYVPFYN